MAMAGADIVGASASAVPLADAPALQTRNRALLTLGVMAATIMQILDSTIANVALPNMQASLGATADTVTWVSTSYIVASAVAIPLTGWLADRIGRATCSCSLWWALCLHRCCVAWPKRSLKWSDFEFCRVWQQRL